MQVSFYLGYLLPSLTGLCITWFCRRHFCPSLVKSAIFLAAQIIFIRYCDTGPFHAQLIVMAILTGYIGLAILANDRHERSACIGSIFFFAIFIFYWAFEKYFLPLGWADALFQHFLAIIPSLSGIGTKTAQHLTRTVQWLQGWAVSPMMAMIGISYMGFKLIHFFFDYRAGDIKKPKVLEFLNWLFFFPSIIAGPMIRFQDWQEQRETKSLKKEQIFDGVRRIVLGLVMKVVIADSIHGLTTAGMTTGALSLASWPQLMLGACSYSVYIYFDFAGYSHIAIGLARFWGIALPENFDEPYRARNLAEFWRRWHITLSLILRDYLFYPISLYLKRIRYMRKHTHATTAIALFVTFLLAGIWHGAGIGYVIFGALHGVGLAWLAIVKRYKMQGAFARWWATSRVAALCSTLMTFFYVSFTYLFFSLPVDRLSIVWHNLKGG